MNGEQDLHEGPENGGPSQGFKQMLALVLLAGAIVILSAVFVIQHELSNQREAMKWTVSEFGLGSPTQNRLNVEFNDEDKDLIADPPTREADWVRPKQLVFSFISGTEMGEDTEMWKPLTDALANSTGLPVECRVFETVGQQIMEMRTQALHITAMNTGSVPLAVNTGGFVPICTPGTESGEFGVTTQVLVPKQSAVRKLADLKDKRIMFTSVSSNSGFKAPLVILNDDFGMQPSIDYNYGFSTSHQDSIRMIRDGEVQAAPVASDLLQRAIAEGEIEPSDYRIIYESERFPPAAFGYLHCLDPEIVEKIRETLIDFDLAATPLGPALGADKLVAINYKNDWALIRRIDNALGVVHKVEAEPSSVVSGQVGDDAADAGEEEADEEDLNEEDLGVADSSSPEQTQTAAEADSADGPADNSELSTEPTPQTTADVP